MKASRSSIVKAVFLAAALLAGARGVAASEPLSDLQAVNKALAEAKPGQTVFLADGVYRDADIKLPVSGEKDKPITLAAQTPGKVLFTGTSRITLAGNYLHLTGMFFHKNQILMVVRFQQANHCRLSHCAFNESGDPNSTFTKIVEVGVDSHDNEIDHCYFARSISMSVGVRGGALRPNIHHNWFRDIVARASNGQEAVQLGGPPNLGDRPLKPEEWNLHSTVEHNLFDGACGDEEIISVKSSDNVIRYNTFLGHPTANKGGLCIRHGHRNVVESNTFLGTAYGVRISGDENVLINNYLENVGSGFVLTAGGTKNKPYIPCRNGLFANNTVVDAAVSPFMVGAFYNMPDTRDPENSITVYPSGNRICNNILTGKKDYAIVWDRGDPKKSELGSNEFQNNLGFCARAKKVEDMKLPTGVTGEDPKLTTGGGRARPGQGSPAIGKGMVLAQVKDDIAGRPRDGKPDIGCEEVSSGASARRRTLTPKDVGPDWMKGDSVALEKEGIVLEVQALIRKYPEAEFRARMHEVIDSAGAAPKPDR